MSRSARLRLSVAVTVLITAVATIGIVSNVVSADGVARLAEKQCEASIEQVARRWELAPSAVRRVPVSSIRTGFATTPEGKRVRVQLRPNERPPFCYAHVVQAAPFILRVQYGWAVTGSRTAFGHGGEQLVISVFGRTKILRDRVAWQF